jgi:ribosome biogenesis GTPase
MPPGKSVVFIGSSGVGKSSLINRLYGDDILVTQEVRASDAKGRHTTTARQLHLIPGSQGGCIIDTPGIRSVGLFTDAESVDAAFADIQELAGSCRFNDCGHATEPGCAVLAACESGQLPQGRYDSWRRLQKEVSSALMRSSPHELRKHAKRFSRAAKEGSAIKRRSGAERQR